MVSSLLCPRPAFKERRVEDGLATTGSAGRAVGEMRVKTGMQ